MACTSATPCTTTLFDLVAAVQENLTAEEEASGVAITVVQELLHRVVRRRPPGRSFGKVVRPPATAHDAAA